MLRAVTILATFLALPLHSSTITLLHFSDYHSHAVPFYSEGRPDQGGIARAIGYLKREKAKGALVFNGGDMVNKGAPTWSDQYRCAEWPWLNGIVDAMALGNHDPDYGYADFETCRASVSYPILSANTEGFQRYALFERDGVRIGVFAVAGEDFPHLVRVPELRYSDAVEAARSVVRDLREKERADAVVMIGHENPDEDARLAAAVPGIDLIFGSHAHLKEPLKRIEGTSTWFISPYQYLTYISRVDLTFEGGKLAAVSGSLVQVDSSMRADPAVARRVTAMQRRLEHDPRYRELFVPFATLGRAMTVDDLGGFTVRAMREATRADVAVSTRSSFRQPLPPGTIDEETLRAAMPYDNDIVVATMTGTAVAALLARAATDSYAFAPQSIDPQKTYRVATTDYMAKTASGYREIFNGVAVQSSGLRVRDEVRKRLSVRSTDY